MEIPIKNLYYLLCYAWDKLPEREFVKVAAIQGANSLDLLAYLFTRNLQKFFQHGIKRDYVTELQEVQGVRGRIHFQSSLSSFAFRNAKTHCEVDQLTYNILPNQIIKTTILRLLRTKELKAASWNELRRHERYLRNISTIRLSPSLFQQVEPYKRQGSYDFLLNICELLYLQLMPQEQEGVFQFVDFREDERKMARLFEAFVYNFYRIEQRQYSVSRSRIRWKEVSPQGDSPLSLLPIMQTDITLRSPKHSIIIDTKFYKKTLQERFDHKSIISPNLYQLYAYLNNFPCSSTHSLEGLLLYPQVDEEIHVSYKIQHHIISVRTINLANDWNIIEHDLLKIVNCI